MTGDDPLLAGLPRDAADHPILASVPLLRRVAKGRFGAVYSGPHPELRTFVAVKVLPRPSDDPEYVDRFLSAGKRMATVTSEHLPWVHEAGADGARLWIVQEFVSGESAASLLGRVKREGGRALPEAEAVAIVRAATTGLAAAHAAGIVHGDVKPANLRVADDRAKTKLTDTGMARPTGVGATPGFAPPEGEPSPAGDVFAMGATLYALVAGRGPFADVALDQIPQATAGREPAAVPGISPVVMAVMRRAMAKVPSKRPPDASALVSELASC